MANYPTLIILAIVISIYHISCHPAAVISYENYTQFVANKPLGSLLKGILDAENGPGKDALSDTPNAGISVLHEDGKIISFLANEDVARLIKSSTSNEGYAILSENYQSAIEQEAREIKAFSMSKVGNF